MQPRPIPNAPQKRGGHSAFEYYTFHDYKRLLQRRAWMIATVTLLVACVTAVVAFRMPSIYQASTTIMVDPGKVPESYVKSTATIDANQRLALLQEQILSTTKLGQVVDEFSLYPGMRKTASMDEIVAHMRKDISVKPAVFAGGVRELQAFEVSYISPNRTVVAQVTNRLASLFIEENMKVREQQVAGTADFFEREIQTAKQDLADKAQKLAQLRSRYFAELPESQNVHIQALTSLQMEVRSEMDAASRAEHQKMYLQSVLADSPSVVNLDNSRGSDSSGLDEELAHLQEEMDQLRSRYGPSYPDVVAKSEEIEKLKQQIKDSDKSSPQASSSAPSTNRKRHNPVIESQIAQLDEEIQKHEARQKELKAQIAYHESALERAPEAEQELTAANDDYANAEDHYKRLEDHKFTADISSDVETRQKGERFVILDPAQPPDHAYGPNRPMIDGFGFAGGIGLSLVLVIVLELLDGTVKTHRELDGLVAVPVLAEIPWQETRSANVVSLAWSAIIVSTNLVLAIGYAGLMTLALR
ncbi:MAG TPA: Wzz/FepE/Etk N-terminal domain-containing protein [Candidatus Binatia bacterium]|nr:Wzz/FepE/Etk N-terminal domain-containing protein [Candidatus Binatia bacterium]